MEETDTDSECNHISVLIDGARLETVGIEGGDLLYCPKCGYISRPKTELVQRNVFEENDGSAI